MYKPETVAKVKEMLLDRIHYYTRQDVKDYMLCISKGNRKIGRVMNVSLAPMITCPNCSECKYLCYDIKACLQYPNTVIDARARNTALLIKNRDEFFRRIDVAMSRRRVNKFFRFHVSGDMVDTDYFRRMVELARKHSDFTIWTYTKNYKAVNAWIAENGKDALPDNLHVMYSEWRGLAMDNPYEMPEFRVVFNDDENKPDPKKVHYCPGNCDVCKALHRGCVAGETTYCHEH